MKFNQKTVVKLMVDMTGKEPEDILLVDVDDKKIGVVDLNKDFTKDSAKKIEEPLSLEGGKYEKSPSLGLGGMSSVSGAEGVAAVTPPAKNKTNNLVAKIEILKQQNVSGSVVCFLVYRFVMLLTCLLLSCG